MKTLPNHFSLSIDELLIQSEWIQKTIFNQYQDSPYLTTCVKELNQLVTLLNELTEYSHLRTDASLNSRYKLKVCYGILETYKYSLTKSFSSTNIAENQNAKFLFHLIDIHFQLEPLSLKHLKNQLICFFEKIDNFKSKNQFRKPYKDSLWNSIKKICLLFIKRYHSLDRNTKRSLGYQVENKLKLLITVQIKTISLVVMIEENKTFDYNILSECFIESILHNENSLLNASFEN